VFDSMYYYTKLLTTDIGCSALEEEECKVI